MLALALPASAQALDAEVAGDPFSVAVVDTDRDRFADGTLGFTVDLRVPLLNSSIFGTYVALDAELVRFTATRVLERRGDEYLLATTDPVGHRLRVAITRGPSGVVRLRSTVEGPLAGSPALGTFASFARARGERHLGFGERSNAVDQTGGVVPSWAEEGPFSAGAGEDFLKQLLPSYTFPTGPATSNFPIPWMLSTRGMGAVVEGTERSTFDLGSRDRARWSVEAEAPELRLAFVGGPTPAAAVEHYSALAGRQPRAAPWVLGPWVQFRDPWPDRFRERDVPTTVAQTYTHYLPCGAHVGRGDAERARVARHHALGYRITTYLNPHVCTSYQPLYDEAARTGGLVRNPAGQPYILTNPFTADEIVSAIDFTVPAGREIWRRVAGEALDAGYDGWMEDFGEYIAADARFGDGTTGRTGHNRYPSLYHGTSKRHTDERRAGDVAVFVRSGFHGSQGESRIVWGGDPTEDWSCSDGLCAALHQLLNMGLSGVALQGSDIGGFHAVVNPRTNDELNIRWIQLGAVSGVMRTQANGYSFGTSSGTRSQVWSPAVLPVWRRYAKLRTQLFPYLAAALREYERSGLPLARHMALVAPEDPGALRRDDQLMLGGDLLVAPVVREGQRRRSLHLPPGRWLPWRDAVAYDEATGRFDARSAAALPGPAETVVTAPLDELPMFIREGAIIPMLPADVDTLSDLPVKDRSTVRLRDRGARRLLAWPRGRGATELDDGTRIQSLERRRSWTLRIRGRRTRRYELQVSLASLRRPFRPRTARLGTRRIRWTYDRRTRTVHTSFRTRSARLTITP